MSEVTRRWATTVNRGVSGHCRGRPWRCSVLSLLNERAMHPYEMRSLMRERAA